MIVQCSKKPHLKNHKYGPRDNSPVNLGVIERFSKSREHYYPDNEGIPVIKFYREGKEVYQWFFEKEEEKLRDEVFNDLANTPSF